MPARINQTSLPAYSTLTSYVMEALREGILSGRFAAGAKLDQQMLASELGVSMIPMRESLRQLEAEGLVRIYPYRGAFVAQLSPEELKEIYLIREVLEELATQLAVPNLTPAALGRLDETLERMRAATISLDYKELLDLNRTFHFTIYSASNRSLLVQTIASLWDRSTSYRRVYTYLPDRAARALAEHEVIAAACRTGEPEAAGRAVRENVRQTTEGVLSKLGAK